MDVLCREICCRRGSKKKKKLSFSFSLSVYMEISFNSELGTELIPSSHYRVDTGAIFFSSHFVRIKIFSHERQIWLKYTLGLMMMNTKKSLQGCLCWFVEEIPKKDLSWHVPLPSTPPMKSFIFRHDCRKRCSLQTTANMKGKWMKWEKKKKNTAKLFAHAKRQWWGAVVKS